MSISSELNRTNFNLFTLCPHQVLSRDVIFISFITFIAFECSQDRDLIKLGNHPIAVISSQSTIRNLHISFIVPRPSHRCHHTQSHHMPVIMSQCIKFKMSFIKSQTVHVSLHTFSTLMSLPESHVCGNNPSCLQKKALFRKKDYKIID